MAIDDDRDDDDDKVNDIIVKDYLAISLKL